MPGRGRFRHNNENCKDCCRAFGRFLRRNLLLILIIAGCVIGFIIGVVVNESVQNIKHKEDRKTTLMLIGFPGELLMNMLKMLVLPLIIASLITAIASLDSQAAGKVGRRTVLYYAITSFVAAILGIVLVMAIKPGEIEKEKEIEKKSDPLRTLDGFLDLIRSFFPRNVVEAAIFSRKTKYSSDPPQYEMRNITNTTTNSTVLKKVMTYAGSDFVPAGLKSMVNSNILGLVVFSVVFGAVLGRLGERGRVLRMFFENLNEVVMIMVGLVMWYAPIGICSLIAQKVAEMTDVVIILSMLAKFIGTVVLGLAIHTLLIQPLMYFVVLRKNPYRFIWGMRDAMVTAFGVDSSAATLPTTIRCAEQHNKIDSRITRFVLPLGATVNMDGTAYYEGVSALFIAQMNNRSLSFPQIITTVITAVAASVGAAAIPHAGLVTMVMVLQAVGLPIEDIGLIYAVDWFLDRCRTMTNVLGDALGAAIVAHLSRHELKKQDEELNGRHYDGEFSPLTVQEQEQKETKF